MVMKNNSKKKIAILYSGGKYFGGIETYLLNLFENIDKNEFSLELLSLGKWELSKRLEALGYKVIYFSSKRISHKTIGSIGKYLKENRSDLLVSQGTVANAYARAVSLLFKIPNLVTVHSDLAGDYPNQFIKTAYGIIEKISRFPTVKYVAVSNFLKGQLIKSGVPAKKITVSYNGLDFPVAKVRPHKRLVIGSVGRLHPVKGYDILIQAFALLENKRLRLKIAGAGDEVDNLKHLAHGLGVGNRVEFVGFQNNIYDFLDSIDVYVQSSRSEGFGLSVVEAMSQALPVAVTPAGSLKEIVEDGRTGVIAKDFSPKSLAVAITKLVDNYDLSKKIGENAKTYVTKEFAIKKWAEDMMNIYRGIIK
jgi:glycosyltransferase involved in cell wall biosynthesis